MRNPRPSFRAPWRRQFRCWDVRGGADSFCSKDTVPALRRDLRANTVAITRQIFQIGPTPTAVDYTDLWWNPSESGWGIAVTQQYGVMFLTWFVYDNSGKPTWYAATSCTVSGASCSGKLYRATGPAFGPAFDALQVHAIEAGTVTLSFSDANHATLTYTVNGVAATKAIARQLF